MMRKILFPILALLLLTGCAPRRAAAQFIGYISPQTVSTTIVNNGACSPFVSTIVPNLGQTVHAFTWTENTGTEKIFANILASNDGVNFFRISDTASLAGNNGGQVVASGYYSIIKVQIQCFNAGTRVSAFYSGTSITQGPAYGDVDNSQYQKNVFVSLAANAGGAAQIFTPYGSEAGYLSFVYAGTGPAGSTIGLVCDLPTLQIPSYTFNLAVTSGVVQVFPVPHFPCESFTVQYTSGGASAATYSTLYQFSKPGFTSSVPSYRYANITTNTNTLVRNQPGILHSITINTLGTAEVLTLFDGTSCAGTKIGTITLAASDIVVLYDVQFQNGLCITTAGTTPGDYTVSFQ